MEEGASHPRWALDKKLGEDASMEEMCEQYLGVVQPKGESIVGFAIKLKWLQENMSLLLAKPIQQKLETHCRAYILQLIGGVLMPDKMRNCVHLMYFIVLADLEWVKHYS